MSASKGSLLDKKLPVSVGVTTFKPGERITSDLNPNAGYGLRIETNYQNAYPFAIRIIPRSGVSFVLPPFHVNGKTNSAFNATIRYGFNRDVKIDDLMVLDVVGENATSHEKALKEALATHRITHTLKGHEFAVNVSISRKTLDDAGGSVYVPEMDIVICYAEIKDVVHPGDMFGRGLAMTDTDNGTVVRYEINDPNHSFGSKFVNIGGTVFSVPVTTDNMKPEGVYRYSNGRLDKSSLAEEFFSFDIAQAKLELFSTVHDAETLGNVAERRKQEYEMLAHKLKTEQMEFEGQLNQQRTRFESEVLQLKEEKARREMELAKEVDRLERKAKERDSFYADEKARRESYSHREKDYYESRSYSRKDSSEIIKWLPAMLIGVGAIAYKLYK